MTELVKSFAELLNQVALSAVDIVDRGTFKRAWDHVVASMGNELEAASFGLVTRSVVDGQPGLQTTWSRTRPGMRHYHQDRRALHPAGVARLRPASAARGRLRGQSGCRITLV